MSDILPAIKSRIVCVKQSDTIYRMFTPTFSQTCIRQKIGPCASQFYGASRCIQQR